MDYFYCNACYYCFTDSRCRTAARTVVSKPFRKVWLYVLQQRKKLLTIFGYRRNWKKKMREANNEKKFNASHRTGLRQGQFRL